MTLPPNLLSAFVTVFVTIGPVETAVVFAALTAGVHRPERKSLAARSVTIAGVVLLLFALGGGAVLSLLRVSLPAFRVAGGVLLFLQALTLTFSNPGLSSISASETRDAQQAGDIAIFPLAFPLIAGPGSLAAVVLVMGRTGAWLERGAVVLMVVICLAVTYVAMLGGVRPPDDASRGRADHVDHLPGRDRRPARIAKSKSAGTRFGLTPKKYQSGEKDVTGSITHAGDGVVRSLLFEAASSILGRATRMTPLKRWALQVAKRRGLKRARVALARKLAVIMHRMWIDGTVYQAGEPALAQG